MKTRRGPAISATTVAAIAFLPVLPALASTIVGTNRPETIRGTPGADRISARGGNDRVFVFPFVHLSCEPAGGPAVSWSQDFGASVYTIRRDGSFTVDEAGTGAVLGTPAPYRVVVTGRLTSGIASGEVTLDVQYANGPAAYACTAPNVGWTAAAGVLNEPRR